MQENHLLRTWVVWRQTAEEKTLNLPRDDPDCRKAKHRYCNRVLWNRIRKIILKERKNEVF